MTDCDWYQYLEEVRVNRGTFRKTHGPADQAVNNSHEQVYHRYKIGIREVIIDLLVKDVENHIQEVPHEEEESSD